jgi:hypothetical protein
MTLNPDRLAYWIPKIPVAVLPPWIKIYWSLFGALTGSGKPRVR